MKFVELSSSEFEKASNNFPGSSFYQSYAWTKIKELTGWKHYFVGVLRDNKLVAISLIIGKKVYLDNKKMMLMYKSDIESRKYQNNIIKIDKTKE